MDSFYYFLLLLVRCQLFIYCVHVILVCDQLLPRVSPLLLDYQIFSRFQCLMELRLIYKIPSSGLFHSPTS